MEWLLEVANKKQQQIIYFLSGFYLSCLINLGSLVRPLVVISFTKIITVLGK
jgi:hypothetical protein